MGGLRLNTTITEATATEKTKSMYNSLPPPISYAANVIPATLQYVLREIAIICMNSIAREYFNFTHIYFKKKQFLLFLKWRSNWYSYYIPNDFCLSFQKYTKFGDTQVNIFHFLNYLFFYKHKMNIYLYPVSQAAAPLHNVSLLKMLPYNHSYTYTCESADNVMATSNKFG